MNLYNDWCKGGIIMNWIQGLTKAIQFIESNLTDDITVNDVVNHVYASNAHYQRVFSLVTGITIGDILHALILAINHYIYFSF